MTCGITKNGSAKKIYLKVIFEQIWTKSLVYRRHLRFWSNFEAFHGIDFSHILNPIKISVYKNVSCPHNWFPFKHSLFFGLSQWIACLAVPKIFCIYIGRPVLHKDSFHQRWPLHQIFHHPHTINKKHETKLKHLIIKHNDRKPNTLIKWIN